MSETKSEIHGHFFFPPSLPFIIICSPLFRFNLSTSSRTISSLYIALSTSACLTDSYISTQQKVICPNTSEHPPAYLPQKNNTAHHLGIQSGDHGNTNFFLCVHPHIQPITIRIINTGKVPHNIAVAYIYLPLVMFPKHKHHSKGCSNNCVSHLYNSYKWLTVLLLLLCR